MSGTTVPIIQPDAPYRTFKLTDIYTGPNGTGRWVPNVDDKIFDWDTGLEYRVTEVDYNTGLSQYQLYIPPSSSNSGIDEDVLLGSGPGSQSESYRAYINTEVVPFRMALDARLRIYGSQASYIKVFKGTDISENGLVISGMFDQNDQLVSENIPLESTINPVPGNPVIKAAVDAYSTEQLQDGEVVTAVVYAADGTPISISKLLVMNTAYVRTVNAQKKYITGIRLTSPFLSTSDNTLLEYPVNVPVQTAVLTGIVEYSNGDSVEMPIDGTKFSLFGISSYVASVVGQRVDLVLNYRLSEGEYAMNVSEVGSDRFISESYTLETKDADGSYTVKLYTFPVWVDDTVGYRLEHYLYNLDRDEFFEVTQYVEVGINSDVFAPKQYGGEQNLVFAIDLNEVDVIYSQFRHVQTVGVTLVAPGTVVGDKWRVRFTPGGDQYGAGLLSEGTYLGNDRWDIDVSSGLADQQTWLDTIYRGVEPLYNPASELEAPEPTHFYVHIGDFRALRTIAQWDEVISNALAPDAGQGKAIYLEFIRQTSGDDLQLGVAALPLNDVTP